LLSRLHQDKTLRRWTGEEETNENSIYKCYESYESLTPMKLTLLVFMLKIGFKEAGGWKEHGIHKSCDKESRY
jgi:hypothetical protein